jgi:hypothetical protein
MDANDLNSKIDSDDFVYTINSKSLKPNLHAKREETGVTLKDQISKIALTSKRVNTTTVNACGLIKLERNDTSSLVQQMRRNSNALASNVLEKKFTFLNLKKSLKFSYYKKSSRQQRNAHHLNKQNKSTQTNHFQLEKGQMETNFFDENAIVRLKNDKEKFYINLKNGFTSYSSRDLIENKLLIFDFNKDDGGVEPTKLAKFDYNLDSKSFKSDLVNIFLDESLFKWSDRETKNRFLKYLAHDVYLNEKCSLSDDDFLFFNQIRLENNIFNDLKVVV